MPEEIKDAGSWNGFLYHKDKLATLRKPLLVTIPQLLDLLTALTGMNGFVVEGLFDFYEHLNDSYTELLKKAFIDLSKDFAFSEMLDNALGSLQADGYVSSTEKQLLISTLYKYRNIIGDKPLVWDDDLSVIKELAPKDYAELMKELLDCVSQKEVKEAIEITFADAWVHGNLKSFSDMLSIKTDSEGAFSSYGGFLFDNTVNYVCPDEIDDVIKKTIFPTAKEVYDKKFSVSNS